MTNTIDDAELQKMYDGRRLCETKLNNIEESIVRLHRQQEHLRRFLMLNTELTEQRQLLYALNKEHASYLNAQRELERFEEFEAVNGRFQRIATLKQSVQDARERLKQVSQEIDEAGKRSSDAERSFLIESKKAEDAEQALSSAALLMTEVERQRTIVSDSERGYAMAKEKLNTLNERKDGLQKSIEENAATYEAVKQEIAALSVQEQALDVHQPMLRRSEAILTMLDELLIVERQREELTQGLNQATRRQDERDEQLSRLFADSQSLKARIESKKEEADGHRRSIAGMDSYHLQRRALELRSRKLMFETGFSLWRSIAAGYEAMEQEQQAVTQLRLHADHLNHDIDKLEREARQVDKQLERKQYHLMLSRSQNVIELRSDLEEGTPCTVCGATHHPRHGEGMTEQNTLIASLKAECDVLNIEQANKHRELQEKKDDLIITQTQLDLKSRYLKDLQRRQEKDVSEWQNFSHLDRSFAGCSSSTNREARTTLMGLLIERTKIDAEQAEKELNAFTFHLDAISTITADLQKLQQEATDLEIRLNEANTACQVMAGQVERMEQRLQAATKDYRRRYEALEQAVSLPDWFRLWKASPESVKFRIQKMREEWEATSAQLREQRHQATLLQELSERLRQDYAQTNADILACENDVEAMQEQGERAESAQKKLVPDGDGKGFFMQAQQQYTTQKTSLVSTKNLYDKYLQELLTVQAERAHLDVTVQELESRIASEQQKLDQWMQRYNASHPPVQMAELEHVLSDEKEWGEIRRRVRENQVKIATTQNRVDYLSAQIIALQAEGLRPVAGDGDQEQASLQEQKEKLEQEQRDVLRRIAHYDQQIHLHEQVTAIGS